MPKYALVDKTTGGFHERDCARCGVVSISGDDLGDPEIIQFQVDNADENHVLIEIDIEEKDRLVEVLRTIDRRGKRVEVALDEVLSEDEEKTIIFKPKYRIDLGKAKTNIKDRKKINKKPEKIIERNQ